MEVLEKLSETIVEFARSHIIITFLVFLFLTIVWKLYQRYKAVVKGDFTYVIVSDKGFVRTLYKSEFIWNPFEWVLRGSSAPDLSYFFYDEASQKTIARPLCDRRTGRIDLLIHQFKRLFEAYSANQHRLTVLVEVSFCLDQELLYETLGIREFGSVLNNRILSALRDELGARSDQDIRKELKSIQTIGLDRLRKQTSELKKKLAKGSTAEDGLLDSVIDQTTDLDIAPLGVKFLELTCHIDATKERDGGALVNGGGEASAKTVMQFNSPDIATLRNVFLKDNINPDPELLKMANAAVLEVLEMHTRQQVAQSLVGSGQLFILSASDFGLFGNAVFREKIRAREENGNVRLNQETVTGPDK